MKKEELIKYELPSLAEFVSIGWLQTIIAWYYAKKVNRKFARYEKRLKREDWIKRHFIKELNQEVK